MFNLFIVFQDGSVADMIVDVLALEFFTMIDDEFKAAVLRFDRLFLGDDRSFLDDMVVVGVRPPPASSPSSASSPRAEGAGSGGEGGADAGRKSGTAGCGAAAMGQVALPVLETVLGGVRTLCRVAGPAFAFFMIFFGPICLGMPE